MEKKKATTEEKAIKEVGQLAQEMEERFERWTHLKEKGGSDPFHEDGINMNLVRNHIFHYRRQIKELCCQEKLQLPKIYYREMPPVVDPKYMANAEVIRLGAAESLRIYQKDSSFQEIERVYGSILDQKTKNIARNILGYKKSLEIAIEQDDLVTMRRHLNYHSYLKSAEDFIQGITKESYMGQMTLF